MTVCKKSDTLYLIAEYVEKFMTRTTVTLARGGSAPKLKSETVQVYRAMPTYRQHSHAGPHGATNNEYIGKYLENYVYTG